MRKLGRYSILREKEKLIIDLAMQNKKLKDIAIIVGIKSPVSIYHFLRRRHIHIKRNTNEINSHFWKGGIRIHNGYIYIYKPNHPYKNIDNEVAGHRLVMEECLGRYLTKKETIHHKNGVKTDNRIENLKLYSDSGWHVIKEHIKINKITGRFQKIGEK